LRQVETGTSGSEPEAQHLFTDLLSSHPLFAALTAQQRERLQGSAEFVTYGQGETIISEGAEGDSMFMICRGQATVSRRTQKGESFTVAQLGVGDLFGEMTLCTGEPRSATVRTRSECELAEITRFSLAQLFEEDPTLLERFSSLVSRRQAELRQLEAEAASAQREDLARRMRRLFNSLLS
jgi:CRP-like cAMP-binding protein